MNIIGSEIPDVLLLEPRVFQDERGFFLEAWNARGFQNETKLDVQFVQDNHSRSARNVLRGLHYQIRQAQGKLVHVVRGRIFDVAVDLRPASDTFRRWTGVELSHDRRNALYVPPGCAHGFLTLSLIAPTGFEVLASRVAPKSVVSYGLEKVRFLAPVRSGKRVRNRIKLAAAECGYGTELCRPPRLPLVGAEREHVLKLIRTAIATRPTKK